MTLSGPEIETRDIEAVDLENMLNPFKDDGTDDPDHKAHYFSPADNLEFQAKHGVVHNSAELVSNARLFGAELTALCGFKMVVSRNPVKYSVCTPCADEASNRLLGG